MDFRIRQLEYFLALADKLNFRKAAIALNIAQPTLSFQIKSLESSFGVPLFDRSQREVRLTPEGERLCDHARSILSQARLAMSLVQQSAEPLTISCGPVGQYTVLPDVLRELQTRRLNIALNVRTYTPEKMKEASVKGQVDLLLMAPKWNLPGMVFEGLREDRLSAVLPDNHPWASRPSIPVAEFCKSPILVMYARECSKHRAHVDGLMSGHGISPTLQETSFANGIHLAMVAAGRGVALAAGSMARANIPGISIVPFDVPLRNMELGMTWHQGNESRALAAFRNLVRDVIQLQREQLDCTLPLHSSVAAVQLQ